MTRIPVPVTTTPIRVRGRAGDGLYWALRTAGASTGVATAYLKALAQEIDVGEIGPDASFDLVVARRRSADGQMAEGDLLYAGIDRMIDRDLQLVRWTAGGKPVWVDAITIGQAPRAAEGLAWPVQARITSGFGYRIHPILRFARMHRGIDFGARWGTPIHAAADGQVTRAGWAGGYGRQVRLAHAGGLASSYSHMSSLSVAPGTMVRQGQVIGYVGSSGLSTGPHLHYEVYRGGVAVNPMSVKFTAVPARRRPGRSRGGTGAVEGVAGGGGLRRASRPLPTHSRTLAVSDHSARMARASAFSPTATSGLRWVLRRYRRGRSVPPRLGDSPRSSG